MRTFHEVFNETLPNTGAKMPLTSIKHKAKSNIMDRAGCLHSRKRRSDVKHHFFLGAGFTDKETSQKGVIVSGWTTDLLNKDSWRDESLLPNFPTMLSHVSITSGMLEFTIVLMGLANSPGYFQATITGVMTGLVGVCCKIYIDDTIVNGSADLHSLTAVGTPYI